MSIPADPGTVPELVTHLAAGRPLQCVWRNQIGGTTWRIGTRSADDEHVKVGPPHPEFDPAGDAERMAWAARWLPVPNVLGHGAHAGLLFLHTRALAGTNAIELTDDPHATARALGVALRRWHDALPVQECPWQWSADVRLAALDDEARVALGGPPAIPLDDLVVCHGDARCLR